MSSQGAVNLIKEFGLKSAAKPSLEAYRATYSTDSHWREICAFDPPGWSVLSEKAQSLLLSKSFPGVDAWNYALDSCEVAKKYYFRKQEYLGQRKRRALKKKYGLSPLGFYLKSIVVDQCIWHREQNWHDFFNGLIWLSFPLSKKLLHQRAWESYLGRSGVGNRSAGEDELTRFDEGGIVEYVDAVGHTQQLIFGHGLLESMFYKQHYDTRPFRLQLNSPVLDVSDLDAAIRTVLPS